jgi:hypothetical protein
MPEGDENGRLLGVDVLVPLAAVPSMADGETPDCAPALPPQPAMDTANAAAKTKVTGPR